MTLKYRFLKFLTILILGNLLWFSADRPTFFHSQQSPHNCRFWGTVYDGELDSLWQETMRIHLDSLKGLSVLNNDGWGFGYYIAPDSNHFLPIMQRGEPMAAHDPRYDRTVEEMISYSTKACIAHVRNASSGPLFGLPNPHPFRRTSTDTSRNLEMLFAHNGTIPTQCLLDLIDADYLLKNPPDYQPNYLDSDLYAIYLLQAFDTFIAIDIDSCIKMAVNTLVLNLYLHNEYAQLNFILTDGSAIWALRYADVSTSYYTLYYFHPESGTFDKWIAASQPLDTTEAWQELPNYSLLTLKPNAPPLVYRFEVHQGGQKPPSSFYLEKLAPNICSQEVAIRFYSPDTRKVTIKLYDESGRAVANIFDKKATKGMNEIRYQPRALPSGIYFIHLVTAHDHLTEKVVIQK